MPTSDRLRMPIVAVALAALVLACGIAAPSASPPPSAGPAAPPAATAAPPTARPTPAASATPSTTLRPAEIEALLASIEASVTPIRELEPKADVPNRVIDEAELRVDLEKLVREAATPEEYAADARLGERLGLFPPGTDLAAMQLDLLGDQVLGYYDEDRDQMAIVQRGHDFGGLERTTFAHEYTHALQDQHFDLARLVPDDLDESDRVLARQALAEGDASLLTQQWALGNLALEELIEITKQSLDPAQLEVLERVPPIIARQLQFPYLEGLAFADALYQQGGWSAVDAAYARPPESTEQVIHPEKYLAREVPDAVEAPVDPADLGDDWRTAATDTLGELAIAVWLQPSTGLAAATDAAAGWGGDRVVMLEGPAGGWLVAWATSWDTAADATAFAEAAAWRIDELGGTAVVRHTPGSSEVQVLVASSPEVLEAAAQ